MGDVARDHAALMGAVSNGQPDETLEIAADPNNSCLGHRLECVSGVAGDSMPPTGALAVDPIPLVRDGAADGAQP